MLTHVTSKSNIMHQSHIQVEMQVMLGDGRVLHYLLVSERLAQVFAYVSASMQSALW